MTRSEFCNEMREMWDLHSFCVENDCEILQDFWSAYDFDSFVDQEVVEYARMDNWHDLISRLEEYDSLINTYQYIAYDQDEGEYAGIDDRDFDRFFDDILEWGDEHEIWDAEEDEEEEQEDEEDLPPLDDPDDQDCSFEDLCASGVECASAVRNRCQRDEPETDVCWDELLF